MQDRNIKGDHFHLEGIGAPLLLREFINLYRWYFLNFRGFKFKMSSPSQSSPSRNYTSPSSGVVLLSLFVAGLQNSRLNRFRMHVFYHSYLFTCQAGWVFSVFTFGYIGVLHGHLLIVAHLYIFLTVLGSFLTTGYLFRDLLLGSVFSHIISIICINKKINGICITMKKLSHSLTFRKML